MNDMSAVIVAKSDQINADDLIAGPRIVTIAGVKISPGTEQPVQMALEGTDKLFRPCKTVSRVIVALWGADANQYVGKSLRLFRDPTVTWAGVKVGGIRIDQASHIDAERTLVVKESQKASKVHKIKPLKVEPVQSSGITIESATKALNMAETIEDLRAVWGSKGMRPFRDELQPLLDKRLSALNDGTLSPDNPAASEKRDDVDYGDQFDGDAR
jgi:hypothetical protein